MFKHKEIQEQLQALCDYLPDGRLTKAKNVSGSRLRQLMLGLAGSFYQLDKTIDEMYQNRNVNYATFLIEEWEKAVGIPDDVFSVASTIEERRENVLLKIRSLGAQTSEDFQRIANIVDGQVIISTGIKHGVFPLAFPAMFSYSGKASRHTIIVYHDPMPSDTLLKIQLLYNRLKPANVQVIITEKP